MAGVTVRTLRHYDDLGLLRPWWVDPRTGYRWYRPDQLHRLHRILALCDLGLALSEIGDALAGDTVDSLRVMLSTKRAELDERIGADIRKLARVDARLALMEEAAMPDYDVIVRALPAQRVILAQERVASVGHIGHAERNLFARLKSIMEANQLERVGPTFATCRFTDEDPPIVVGAAVPIDDNANLAQAKDVEVIELPAVLRAATTIINGQPNFDSY